MLTYLFRKLSPTFAPLALVSVLVAERPAAAGLIFNFFPSGSDVVINSVGSLNLPSNDFESSCFANGFFRPENATICTGYDAPSWGFYIDGPDGLGFTKPALYANSVAGPVVGMAADVIVIDKSYALNSLTIFNSTATFNNTTLSDLGFTTTGVIATWNLRGSSQTVQVVATPGPLPLLGSSVAFGFSRSLRRLIRLSQPAAKS